MNTARPLTIVSFHAHPDDEVLLTGGTLASAAAAGHRVVIVTATRGEAGAAGREDGRGEALGVARLAELERATEALGGAAAHWLGYADSGLAGEVRHPRAFAHAPVDEAASALAALLVRERADVLTVYDANGGYGHPDHLQVHRVGVRAAEIAGTPRVLAATLPRGPFRAATRLLRLVHSTLGRPPVADVPVFSYRGEITHVAAVSGVLDRKLSALAAHATQGRDVAGGARTVRLLLALPRPLARLVLGREWFVQLQPPIPGGRPRPLDLCSGTDDPATTRPALR